MFGLGLDLFASFNLGYISCVIGLQVGAKGSTDNVSWKVPRYFCPLLVQMLTDFQNQFFHCETQQSICDDWVVVDDLMIVSRPKRIAALFYNISVTSLVKQMVCFFASHRRRTLHPATLLNIFRLFVILLHAVMLCYCLKYTRLVSWQPVELYMCVAS